MTYRRRIHVAVAFAAGVALLGAGCRTWRDVAPAPLAPTTRTHRMRVTTNQGTRRLTLERATVRSDSVAGIVTEAEDRRGDDWVPDRSPDPSPAKGQRIAIAAAEVGSLEKRGTSWTRTTGLIGVTAGLLVLAGYGLLAWGMSQPGY